MPDIHRSARKLSPARVQALGQLARRVDARERRQIRARGRELFGRHERLRVIVQALREERLRQGLSLSEIARRTGIAKPNLSRLEHSPRAAPTLDTLQRYAEAVGKSISVELVEAA